MKALQYHRPIKLVILFLAVFFSLYHIYFGYYPTPGAMSLRITHVCVALMLCYLLVPAKKQFHSNVAVVLDSVTRIIAAVLSLAILLYVIRDTDAFEMQTGYLST